MSTGAVFLFAADLDGTLLPNTNQSPDPGCTERTRELLQGLRAQGHPVCFVTGRHLFLAQRGVDTFRLSPPDWWVCNVGTEIYDRQGKEDTEWRRRLGPELDRSALRRALYGIPQLTPQEFPKQGAHKFSFYYPKPASRDLQADILERVAASRGGLQLVASVEESSGRALLDLIPATAGKAQVVEYLAWRHGLALDRVFFAGDSGNDFDVLLSGACGTLVGNALPEVRDQVRRLAVSRSEAHLYIAGSYYGDGVIEGLRHYGLWPPAKPSVPV